MIEWIKDNWWWAVPAYLVVSFVFAVGVGKFIAFGTGSDLERDDANSQ